MNSNAAFKTDENFIQCIDEDHHIRTLSFEEADLGMILQFPFGYMRYILVTFCLPMSCKKILQIFVYRSHKHKFSAKMTKEIPANQETIAKWIPCKFAK